MEKKKILLIAIITGIFLTAVILFPLVLLSNSKATTPEVPTTPEIYNTPPASADIMGMVTTPPQQRDTSQNITINNFSPDANAVEGAKNPDGSVTINVLPTNRDQSVAAVTQTPTPETPPRTTTVSPSPPASETPPRTTAEKPAVSPNPPKPSTPPPPASTKPTTPARTAPAKTTPPPTAVKPPPKQQGRSEYWIQTGSFTVKANADKAKALLDEKGIPKVVVENSVVREQTVFRLRSGPHRTKEEVEFWLNLVKALDGFKESYILER
jgi:cell division protein FtsN